MIAKSNCFGAIVAGMLLVSVGESEEPAVPAAAPAAAVAEPATPAEAAAPVSTEGVYAIVDGRTITDADIDRIVNNQMAAAAGSIPPEQLPMFRAHIRPRIADQLVLRESVLAYAEKNGLKPTAEEAKARLAEIVERIGGEEPLAKLMEEEKITRAELEQDVLDACMIEKTLESIGAPTEEEIARTFADHKGEFGTPEEVTASHILIGFESGDTDEQKAEKMKKAQAIRERLARGEDFASLAKENSTCPSAPSGGDLGTFGRGRMVAEFENAAFTLETGKVSDVVQTQFGYHLIKVTAHQQPQEPTLESAREDITDMLKEQKVEELVMRIRKESKVVYPNAAPAAGAVAPAPAATEPAVTN